MSHTNHELARKFFAALFSGDIRDELLTPGMTAWTTLGPVDKASYQGGVKALASLFVDGFNYTIDSLTAEEDRVAAEIRSNGKFADGDAYENVYVFVLRIRDGRIASVAEHFNPDPVVKKILPRIQAVMAKAAG
jgi:ketosteroid isomerase-like protein